MMIEAGAAINGIKVAMDMAKGIAALKTETDINLAIINISRTLIEAQAAALSDKEKISDLSRQISDLHERLAAKQKWEDEKNRYTLKETPLGSYCYELLEDKANSEPHHMLCEKCFNAGQKSILHKESRQMGQLQILACKTCKSEVRNITLQVGGHNHAGVNNTNSGWMGR
jgi:hypothetical protein